MKAYVITYEVNWPFQSRDNLVRGIKAYGTWAKLGASSYVILSDHDPVQIRNYLMSYIGQNDKLFVGALIAPAAWNGMPEDVSNWLMNNMK